MSTHTFDPKNMKKLDNEWRRQVLPPIEVLQTLGLTHLDILADIGCGIGYFTLPAANMIHDEAGEGTIYGLDTSIEMLDEVKRRAYEQGIEGIKLVQTAEYDLKLPESTVTFGLLVNVLHEVEDKISFVTEVHRLLKTSGKIAIVEWEKKVTENGPPLDHRISLEDVEEILGSCGFKTSQIHRFADTFYGIVGEKV